MSFIEQAKEALKTGNTDEQWVYNRQEKRLVEINLGSGVYLEVVYYTTDDVDLDNIDEITIVEHGIRKLLQDDEIKVLAELNII